MASLAPKVLAPVQLFGLDGRYATALYSAATKEKSLSSVEKELLVFKDVLKTDGLLSEFLKNPVVKRETKKEAIQDVCAKKKASEITKNFLLAVAENGRLGRIESIIDSFQIIMAAERGEVTCEVITAKALDAAIQKDLEASLQAFVKKGQTLKINTKVDPNIIGGMILSIGDRYLDMSMASKIKKYSDLISAAV